MAFNIDIVLPCGRPRSHQAKKTINSIIKIKKKINRINIIIVGPNLNELFVEISNQVTLIDTKVLLKPSENRNIGAMAGSSEFIFFIDDDCVISFDNFLKVIQIVNDNDKCIDLIGFKISSQNKKIINLAHDFSGFTYQQLPIRLNENQSKHILFVSAAMLVSRKIFSRINGFDESLRYFEDADFSRRCIKNRSKILYAGDISIIHLHNRNLLADIFRLQFISGIDFINYKKKYKKINKNSFFLYFSFILIPLKSLVYTLRAINWNYKYRPEIFIVAPFLFFLFSVHLVGNIIGQIKFLK